ncbi:uncharacterized protein BJ171DRAFT_484532 [Polychytrium aggregatum]|uniref:uncharacterized protein n=1 Tax=Polychytrium aggregatum TaxID=110093 RepID=UPI0022FF3168|nr:uncharacterized protein BJ171DRAFT_484532 [Polychytrium aggregatum]KAI9209606.1 hypothetical protein BJ171DRAFT_484532 [Polychytrium aggregatum]
MSLKDLKAIIGEIYGSKKPSTVAASTAVGAVEKPQRTADGSKSSRGVKANAHTSGPARNDPPRVIVAHKGEMQAVRVTAVASKSKELPSGSNRHGENGGTAARKKPASVSNSEHTLSSQVKAEPAQRVFVKVAKDAEKPRKAASTLSVSERRNIASKSTESVVSASTTGRSKLVARSSSVVGSKKPEHPAQPGQPGHFADHRHDHKAGSHLTLHHAPGKSPNEKPPSTMHLFNSTLSPVRADALDGRPTSIPTPHGTMKKRLPSQHSSVSIQQPALSAQPGVDRPAQEQRTSKPSSRAKSASIATSDSARATYAESLPKTADTGRSRSRSAAASIDADVDID